MDFSNGSSEAIVNNPRRLPAVEAVIRAVPNGRCASLSPESFCDRVIPMKEDFAGPSGRCSQRPRRGRSPIARRRRLSVTPLGVLDEEWENTFRRWYPAFRPEGQPAKKAA